MIKKIIRVVIVETTVLRETMNMTANQKPIITAPKIKITVVNPVKYTSIDGHTVTREKGQIADAKGNLVRVNAEWVYRDATGGYVDHAVYVSDLVERNNLEIIHNKKG